jgi:hypothetical protein
VTPARHLRSDAAPVAGDRFDAIVRRAVQPASTPGDRTLAAELLDIAGDRRAPLDAVRAELQRRLARRSDDFEATRALRLVEGALTLARRADGAGDRPAAGR